MESSHQADYGNSSHIDEAVYKVHLLFVVCFNKDVEKLIESSPVTKMNKF